MPDRQEMSEISVDHDVEEQRNDALPDQPHNFDLPESVTTYANAETYDLGYRMTRNDQDYLSSVPSAYFGWHDQGKEVTDVRVQEQGSPYLEDPRYKRDSNGWRSPEPVPSKAWTESVRDDEPKRSKHSKKFWLICLAVIAIVLVGAGVGVGVGVGLGLAGSSGSGNGELSQYMSKTGAFNGSGIAFASQSFSATVKNGTQGAGVIYFQHWTGEIRYVQYSNAGEWVGGSPSEVVATDAKDGTPLSAVSYSVGGENTWHIFYIDKNNIIKQRSNSNTTNVWIDGQINESQLVAMDSDHVGMQACWYGSDYGDSDYEHSPLPPGTAGKRAAHVGMHMWYASDETTFKQLGWRYAEQKWTPQGEFTGMDGHAGVGCYSWAPSGSVTYVMFVNTEQTAEIYWKDTNSSLKGTEAHPINKWVKAPVSIPNVNSASSLGYTNYFYTQMADNNMINGYNISWAAENTEILLNDNFTVEGKPGLSGTHMGVTAIPSQGGGDNIYVFYQVDGDDITEYTRDIVGGQWTSLKLPIPHK